jgi:hypothetical protein
MATSNPNLNPKGQSPSRLDSITGDHTTPIIVGLLFVITLIAFVILVCVKKDTTETLITGFFSLLSALIGFFAGSRAQKK